MRSFKESKSINTFAKLKSLENYEKWAQEIGFALLNASLMTHANGTSSKSELYTKIAPFSKKNPLY